MKSKIIYLSLYSDSESKINLRKVTILVNKSSEINIEYEKEKMTKFLLLKLPTKLNFIVLSNKITSLKENQKVFNKFFY